MFSKLKSTAVNPKKDDEADEKANDFKEALKNLAQYLAIMTGVSVCAIIFSQVCSYKFILLVFSSTWATESAVNIMKAYCVLLLFMALNGISEAFAYGTSNQKALNTL